MILSTWVLVTSIYVRHGRELVTAEEYKNREECLIVQAQRSKEKVPGYSYDCVPLTRSLVGERNVKP